MSSLFQIGINGLQAQQAALNVTGQNITNASTPGYSRQRAEISSLSGTFSGGVFSGAGSRVDAVTRIADQFINNQIRVDQSLDSELGAFATRTGQLEAALYDDGFGIDSAMREFFDALQNASNNPLDAATRQFVLSRGTALAERFNTVSERVLQQGLDLNAALEAGTSRVNEIADLVADTNRRIAVLQDSRDTGSLNILIDQRDELLKELSSWISVNTSEQADGQINVFIGKGQSLVLGTQTAALSVADNGAVFLQSQGTSGQLDVTSALSGGEVGGLLGYREQVLHPAQNQLGHLAAVMSFTFNEQHHLGIDLAGNFGGNFFRDLNDPTVISQRMGALPGGANTGFGEVNVYIDDPLVEQPSDYEVRINDDGAFSITRQRDGELVFQGPAISPPTVVAFDGLRVEFASGQFNPGDTMVVRPYASIGTEMSVVLTDPAALALAAPVSLGSASTNQGTASLAIGEIVDAEHPVFSGGERLMPPLLVRFLSESQYEILDNSDPTNPRRLEPDLGLQNYVPGSQNHVLPYLPGTSVVTTSGPQVSALPASPSLVNNLDAGDNGYPIGTASVSVAAAGGSLDTSTVNVPAGSSAREIAERLSSLPGVAASAHTEVTLSDLVNFDGGVPVEVAVNGELLSGFTSLNELADAINANDGLSSQGIVARSDGSTLTLTATFGDDLNLHFQGDPNESITVTNGSGDSLVLNGSVAGSYRQVTVGGEVSAILDPGYRLSTGYDGVFAAAPEHQRADLGFDLLLSGNVAAGDEYTINFNDGASGDNRNALALGFLPEQNLVGDPPQTFGGLFAGLIQNVGAAASQAQINKEASAALLQQSESYRESISGVNLDEEAANLIRFEQAYNASAQIISVARDTFQVLLNSVA